MLKYYNFKWLFTLIYAWGFQYSFAQNPCTPSVEIDVNMPTICKGTPIAFTIKQVSDAGTKPKFQWYKNGNILKNDTLYVYYAGNTTLDGDKY